jgi:hypothetical protein
LKRMSAHWEIKCVTSTFFTILTFLPQGCWSCRRRRMHWG